MRLTQLVALATFTIAAGAPSAPLVAQQRARRDSLAGEFLSISGTDSALARQSGARAAAGMQRPEFAAYQDLFAKWAERYLGYDVLRPQLVRLVAEEFTAAELGELITFYRTPLGRKYAAHRLALTARYSELIAAQHRAHDGELIDQVRARAAAHAVEAPHR
jgi:uncharacterized protein